MSGTLARALQLSQHMLAAAQRQAWDTVAALEMEREPLLLGALAPDAGTRAQLALIIACNRDIASRVADARDAAAVQWQRENTRAQAVAAYAQA
jgi:hypothetical protein